MFSRQSKRNQERATQKSQVTGRREFRDAHYLSSLSAPVIKINASPADLPPRVIKFDLRHAYLPAVKGGRQKSIADVATYAAPIRRAINLALLNTSPSSTARSTRIASIYAALVHFCEWCWIRGLTDFAEISPDEIRELTDVLAKGYWGAALDWEARVRAGLKQAITDGSLTRFTTLVPGPSAHVNVNPKGLSQLVGSLISTAAIPDFVYEMANQYYGIDSKKKKGIAHMEYRVTSSALTTTFTAINLLFEIYDEKCGLPFRPYPSPKELANKLGRRVRRTPTLEIDQVGILFKECCYWIFDVAPLVIDTAKRVSTVAPPIPIIRQSDFQHHRALLASLVPNTFNELAIDRQIDAPLVNAFVIRRNHEVVKSDEIISLRDVVKAIHEAGNYLVALTTAKRAAQISDYDFGLFVDSLVVISEEFGIYELPFRLTKKRNARTANEQVSRLTADTVKCLKSVHISIREMFRAASDTSSDDHVSLFTTPLGTKDGGLRYVYSRIGYQPDAKLFYDRLRGIDRRHLELRPHVARRMYAIIYYYRFEMPDLLALSERLNHADIEVTKIYVTTDSGGTVKIEPLDREKQRDIAALRKALDEEASNYFKNKILVILKGGVPIGGFPKLIRRYLRWFYRADPVQVADNEEIADKMTAELVKRGYRPASMWHGVCFATEKSVSKLAARCANGRDGALHRERACPSMCRQCPHYLAGESFLDSLNRHRNELEQAVISGGLVGIAASSIRQQIAEIDLTVNLITHEHR